MVHVTEPRYGLCVNFSDSGGRRQASEVSSHACEKRHRPVWSGLTLQPHLALCAAGWGDDIPGCEPTDICHASKPFVRLFLKLIFLSFNTIHFPADQFAF